MVMSKRMTVIVVRLMHLMEQIKKIEADAEHMQDNKITFITIIPFLRLFFFSRLFSRRLFYYLYIIRD